MNGQEILHMFKHIAPYFNSVIASDIGFSLFEGDTCTMYVPADNLDFGLVVGEKMKPGSVGEKCMIEKKRLTVEVSKEKSAWGIPYIACAIPFLDEHEEAVGCIVTTERIDKQYIIKNTADKLTSSSENLAQSLQELSMQSETIVSSSNEMRQSSDDLAVNIKSYESIIDHINSIASQTNILGLNAAIEAGRVGTIGSGFKVVADEVRKLAHNSSDAVKQIREIIFHIEKSFAEFGNHSQELESFIKNQAGIIQEIAASSEELTSMAQELNMLTNEVSEFQ